MLATEEMPTLPLRLTEHGCLSCEWLEPGRSVTGVRSRLQDPGAGNLIGGTIPRVQVTGEPGPYHSHICSWSG